MKTLLKALLAALCLATLSAPVLAQFQPRAYAPDDLRELSYNDQVRVISREYEEQSGGRRIPDDQLRFYLDQVNQAPLGCDFDILRGMDPVEATESPKF